MELCLVAWWMHHCNQHPQRSIRWSLLCVLQTDIVVQPVALRFYVLATEEQSYFTRIWGTWYKEMLSCLVPSPFRDSVVWVTIFERVPVNCCWYLLIVCCLHLLYTNWWFPFMHSCVKCVHPCLMKSCDLWFSPGNKWVICFHKHCWSSVHISPHRWDFKMLTISCPVDSPYVFRV